MDRYRWNILGLCEMRWKNFGETTTEEGHKVFFSEKEDKHEHGVGTGKTLVNPSAMIKQRGLRLPEFANFNDLVLANTFGHRKAFGRWTWHSPNGQHHNQIDYILVRKRF